MNLSTEKQAPTGMFRKHLRVIRNLLFLLLGILLSIAALLFFFSMDQEVAGRGAFAGMRTYELKSSVQSRIVKINFKEGSQVKAGDVLLELDNRAWRKTESLLVNQIRELEQEIAVKEAALRLLRLDPLPAEYRHTRISLDESKAEAKNAENELSVYRHLRERGVVAELEYHQRELNAMRAKSELERLEYDFTTITKGLADMIVRKAEEELGLLKTRLGSRRAELDNHREDVDEYRVLAPENGTISYIPTKLGTYVEPGQILVNIAAGGGRKFIAQIDETDIHKICEGQIVRVASTQYDIYEYGYLHGKVLFIGELPEERAGRTVYSVFIQMDPTDLPIRIGSTGEAKIKVGRSRIISSLAGWDK